MRIWFWEIIAKSAGLVQVGSALADFECCLCNPGSTPGPGLSFFLSFYKIRSSKYSIFVGKPADLLEIFFPFSLFTYFLFSFSFGIFTKCVIVSLLIYGGFLFGKHQYLWVLSSNTWLTDDNAEINIQLLAKKELHHGRVDSTDREELRIERLDCGPAIVSTLTVYRSIWSICIDCYVS